MGYEYMEQIGQLHKYLGLNVIITLKMLVNVLF